MKKVIWILIGIAAAFLAHAQSTDMAPDALAKKVTDEVVAIIRADKDIQAGNRKKVLELVESKVLPNFDFAHMTRLAVGAPWRQATPAQQQALTNEFKTLLVNTYTNAFISYRDQTITYRPLKVTPSDTDVMVRSSIKQASGEPIEVNYSMEKTDKGWKVYDVVIAGISLVQNYRSSFATEIQKAGIDGLISTLTAKNKQLAAK